MKVISLLFFFSLLVFVSAQAPDPPGGPYENEMDVSSEISNFYSDVSLFYGDDPYFKFYWSVTETTLQVGVVCRVLYKPGTVQPYNNNTWCGFGFSDAPSTMFAPGSTSDAVIAHYVDEDVYIEDFRLADKKINSAYCNDQSVTFGVCRDTDFQFISQTKHCQNSITNTSGFVTTRSNEEKYISFTFTRDLLTQDEATCDKDLTLGATINPIFSIGFLSTPNPWPYSISNTGDFVHSGRGPKDSITFTLKLRTTTGEQSTEESFTTGITTEITSDGTTQQQESTTGEFTTESATTGFTTRKATGAPINSDASTNFNVFNIALVILSFLLLL